MDKLASVLADYVCRHNDSCEFSYETYKFSFLILLETIAGVLTGIYIAIRLNTEIEAIVFFGTFFVLRSYAGGLHFSNFGKCYLGSACIMLATMGIVKYCRIPVPISIIMLLISFGGFLAAGTGTDVKGDEKSDMDKTIHFKKKLRQALTVVTLLYVFFLITQQLQYASTVALTTLIVCLLMLIGRWKER